ncbi:MAG: hypothetical protein ABIQ30_18105 [Devosia sp.]
MPDDSTDPDQRAADKTEERAEKWLNSQLLLLDVDWKSAGATPIYLRNVYLKVARLTLVTEITNRWLKSIQVMLVVIAVLLGALLWTALFWPLPS